MSGRALEPEQRARLLGAKLQALLSNAPPELWGAVSVDDLTRAQPVAFGGGAAIIGDASAWVLVDDPTTYGLGAVLAWAASRSVEKLHVLADDAGQLARHAGYFADPPAVFTVSGREVRRAEVNRSPAATCSGRGEALIPELQAAGLDVVIEHGVVTGEVLGLEVARVMIDPDGSGRIEVGVGRNDREAFTMLHGNLPPEDAIRMVADAVRQQRRAGAPSHPLNRLGSERWLLAHLRRDPDRLSGWHLEPVPGVVPRVSVNDRLPAFAVGTDDRGQAVVLAASVGIDLELVPSAADVRSACAPGTRLVLAVPARDAHGATRTLAAALAEPAEVLAIEGDWRR